jgi:hypothetical protein
VSEHDRVVVFAHVLGRWEGDRASVSAAVAAVVAPVATVVAAILAAILSPVHAVGDDGGGADDGGRAGDGSPDDAAASCSSWAQWHVTLLR